MLYSKILATFDDQSCLLQFFDELSVDKRDSDHFISRTIVRRSSDSSYNCTDSSLVTVGYQLHFLALCALDLLIWHARGTIA